METEKNGYTESLVSVPLAILWSPFTLQSFGTLGISLHKSQSSHFPGIQGLISGYEPQFL